MNRCAAQGCGRWTRAGEAWCARHRPDDDDAAEPESDEQDGNGHAAFRSRLATGDYEAVIGRALRSVLHGAAAAADLDAEIGALRVIAFERPASYVLGD
ncbi:MAG: hypothetical protein U0031_22185 [Thermomicrobiales bacterium]